MQSTGFLAALKMTAVKAPYDIGQPATGAKKKRRSFAPLRFPVYNLMKSVETKGH